MIKLLAIALLVLLILIVSVVGIGDWLYVRKMRRILKKQEEAMKQSYRDRIAYLYEKMKSAQDKD